ncbi:hypothetical protein ACWV26_11490 [Rummeliibacillus sp. JY-2-4R]
MKKFCIILFSILAFVVGCSLQGKTIPDKFLLGNFGMNFENNKTYYLVVPIEWTGESSVTVKSIELMKRDEMPITYEEDGINYEFFGADPLKKSGIYADSDIGDLKNINNLEIKGKGKVAIKLSMKDVKEDSERRVKIKFNNKGNEREEVVKWKTLEQLSTDSKK